MVSENGKVLEYRPTWYGNSRFEPLRRISQDLKFPPDVELAGRVWSSKKTEIIEDIFSAPNGSFMRIPVCRQLGLKAAFGVPVLVAGKVEAVFIFFIIYF